MSSKSRLTRCALWCLLPLVPIAARLGYLQIVEHGKMASMARGEAVRETIEIVPRGRILDRSGKILAQSLPSWSSFIDPSEIRQPRRAAILLAKTLGLNPAEILRKAQARSRFVWLKRKLDLAQVQALQSLKLQGIGVVPDEQRYYPNADSARGLLGLVGMEGAGLSGLELQYDKDLSGAARKIPLLRDGSGHAMEMTPRTEAAPVPDLVLTVDRNIQHFAEAALLEGVERHHPDNASVIVQDPRTGEILALASYPSDPLKIPAFQDAYEPGSTFKLVAMTGVLEEGLSKPKDSVDAEGGRWEVSPKVVIKDHEPGGVLVLPEVMTRSSNIGMAKLGLRLGPARFSRWARAYGFGSRTGLGFPGESGGILKDSSALTRVVLANNSFGQGVSVTALQLVGAYSALANGGTLLEPRLVLRAGNRRNDRPVPVRRIASDKIIRILVSMLEGVVQRGTGVSAQISGHRVAGKTGTAQKIDPATGRYYSDRYVASFVGFAPVSAPRWTILVVMDNPKNQYYGADVAAPVFSNLLRRLLALEGVKPDAPVPSARDAAPQTLSHPSTGIHAKDRTKASTLSAPSVQPQKTARTAPVQKLPLAGAPFKPVVRP